jgi:hypothetical protein
MLPSLLLAFLTLQTLQTLQQAPEPERFLPRLAPAATITLEAAWEPCRRSKYGLFAKTEALRAPKPAELRHTYTAAELAPFLPAKPVAVGETWPVARGAVIPFLRQFHAGARSELHHDEDEGAFACLRAVSATRFELLFRAHAEFQLTPDVVFTPAQFEGRLVLERDGRPLALTLELPDRDTNVDVNVADGTAIIDGVEQATVAADIGWVPHMKLASPVTESGTKDGEADESTWTRTWTSSIPDAEARLRLARGFYAFARLEWLSFGDAYRRARERDKPMLVVVLFGTLDDESC